MDDGQGKFDFDLPEGERRKEKGMERAALSRKQLLEVAQEYAVKITRQYGEASYDDVYRQMANDGLHPERLGNAAGSVFRRGIFEFTGRWVKSGRATNHARVNRIWRLRRDAVVGMPPKKDVQSAA